MATSPEILNREVDARFVAQTGFKPGQKLDPSNPTDKAMIPVWLDIQKKVKAEDAAGKLVTTFDHPAVAQHLSDAAVAHQAAAAHLDAAAVAPDPQTVQQNVAAAATATQVAAQKAIEAAAKQPSTASPQLVHEAAHEAAQNPPSPQAPAAEHIAHEQAKTAGAHHAHTREYKNAYAAAAAVQPHSRDMLMKETDARFWAQSGYRIGQKLDPSNPADLKMLPIWMDVYKKVQAEEAAGKLVLTYNHPEVAQNLADAHVADQAAAAHLDAAAGASHPSGVKENIVAALTAAQVAAQKAREAAAKQPATVAPKLVHETVHAGLKNPPPPHAPTRDHLAHEQMKRAGEKADEVHRHAGRHRPKSTVHPHKVKDHRERAVQRAHQAGAPYVLVIERPDGTMEHQAFATRAELDAAYAQLSEHHDQYAYLGSFDLAASPTAPVVDSIGMAPVPPEHAEPPGPAPSAPSAPEAPGASTPSPTPEVHDEGPPKKKMSTGAIIALGLGGIAALVTVVTVATRKKKPSRGKTALVVAPRGSRVRSVGVGTP